MSCSQACRANAAHACSNEAAGGRAEAGALQGGDVLMGCAPQETSCSRMQPATARAAGGRACTAHSRHSASTQRPALTSLAPLGLHSTPCLTPQLQRKKAWCMYTHSPFQQADTAAQALEHMPMGRQLLAHGWPPVSCVPP